ncbi:hypothetical protein LXQ17_001503 [Escherichia coli]|uniref:hypothetical protein n=1 Tax=Escherichia coli TaxID=562 RepID=UPI0010CAF9E7|nr:hypothetical protein [Escherichia coli]EFP8750635.1 hypothetical protein [Shigella flexneri]EKH5995262.1 hypothetical protein [Escherichia coli O8]MCF0257797.1 hypothetical protein [Bacteroides heparinolyticus]EEC9337273.1 hypothetical protein [Escherichia coli]EEQ1662613.1 hypothetical protein [Escherichia coli]
MKMGNLLKRINFIPIIITFIFPVVVIAETKTYSTTVVVDIPVPTCSLVVPNSVDLGTLTPGENVNWLSDINIEVDCATNTVKYGVYMTSNNEKNSSYDGIYLNNSDNSRTNVLLQIVGSNGKSNFTTNVNNPVYIHEGTHNNKMLYSSKLFVYVPYDAKAGQVSGVVTFLLHYPA